jgi:ribose 5-phosphate isomerase B
MKIYIGADHNGFHLKADIIRYLTKAGYDVEDVGNKTFNEQDDFPLFASQVALQVLGSDDKDPRGILLCGGAQGMSMAANRFRGIRASVVWDETEAKMTRNDNDSNVLCLPARVLTDSKAYKIIDTWLDTPFAKTVRYMRRNQELDEL